MTLIRLFTLLTFALVISACSTEPVKPLPTEEAKIAAPVPEEKAQSIPQSEEMPPSSVLVEGKELRLINMMDGGACKNDRQGVQGVFLTYASPGDIDRIKKAEGAEVFNGFAKQIESMALKAMKQAVDKTEFDFDPFALSEMEAQLKITEEWIKHFDQAVAVDVKAFINRTSLTIAITPFIKSLVFHGQGCEIVAPKEQ
ncbi:MAG: hypothetical protein KGZ88_12910 [Methylomicrobium sp.]|nr:hypothetical protein [Methylomicrobium sp.]